MTSASLPRGLAMLVLVVLAWTLAALVALFAALFVALVALAVATGSGGPIAAVPGAGSFVLVVGLSLLQIYVILFLIALPGYAAAWLMLPGPSRPSPSPRYDELDVAWGYAVMHTQTEPDEVVLMVLRSQIEGYAAQRTRELGRSVELVGAMRWDTPRLRELPRWVRALILRAAPAELRRGRRLRRDVTLVRAWQRTDYEEKNPEPGRGA